MNNTDVSADNNAKSCNVVFTKNYQRGPLKAIPANSRTYSFYVLKCNCQYYNAIVGSILIKSRFATLGA